MAHDADYHEALKNNPRLAAVLTSNPKAQWSDKRGEKTSVLFVWRLCDCGSHIALTVAQEAAIGAVKGDIKPAREVL